MFPSIDKLIAIYSKRWIDVGYRIDGKGFLVLAKAKDDFKLATKGMTFETKAFDEKAKLWIAGVANAKEIDRMNEVLDPAGVDDKAYQKNAMLLRQHNHDYPIGQVTALKSENDGVKFEAWVGDPVAGPLTDCQIETRSLIAQKILKAVSVGFIPTKIRMPSYNDRGEMVDPAVIERWEMLELSVVSVPCNAGSLFDAKDSGGDDDKSKDKGTSVFFPRLGSDGKFYSKSGDTMDELKELLKGLATSITDMSKGINSLVDGQKTVLSAIETVAKGKKPKTDDGDDDDMTDDDKKALNDKIKKLEGTVKELKETVDELVTLCDNHAKTIEALVKA